MTCLRITPIVGVLAFAAVAFAAESTTRPFGAEGRPAIVLDVPTGWIGTSAPGSRVGAVAVRFNAREPAGPSAMNLMFMADPPNRPTDDTRLRDLVSEAARDYLDDSVEKRANLQPLGDGLDGYRVTLTDTTPSTSKRNYACATIVGRRFGNGVLLANVLHPKDSEQLPRALQVLRTAALPTPGPATRPTTTPAATQRTDRLRLVSADGKWAVVLDWPGLPMNVRTSRRPTTRLADGTITAPFPGSTQPTATGEVSVRTDAVAEDGTEISIAIDLAAEPGDALAARDYLVERRLKRTRAVRKMTLAGSRDLGLVTFTTGGPNRSAVGTLVHDGRWVVVNISNPMATDAELRAMTQAIKSMRIEPVVGASATAPGTTRPSQSD